MGDGAAGCCDIRWLQLQVAVCMILLIAAGLLMRGLYFAQTVDPGFSMNGIAVVTLDLRTQGYKAKPAAAFERRLKEKVAGVAWRGWRCRSETDPAQRQSLGDEFLRSWKARRV